MRKLKRGLTLVELIIALVISAILALAAAPYLGDYVANSRLREAGNTLLAQTLLAQSEARSRNVPVRLSVAGNNIRLLDISAGAPGVLLREQTLAAPLAAAADTNIDFGSDGRLRPLNPGDPVPAEVAVNLVLTGSNCSADRRCPGLRVEAGGAIRLCGDTTQTCS